MSATKLRIGFDEGRVDALFEGLDQYRQPGGAVGIALGGVSVYRKAYGLASLELPLLLTPSTRLRIASISKHFASLAYLLLCEEGKAQLDEPISPHFPEIHPSAGVATARQLMGHTSGLRDAHDICFQLSGIGQRVTSADLLSLYETMDTQNAAPGTRWIYNNGAYLLLSALIERIAGQPLETVLRERVLEPIGMHDTLLQRCDTEFVPNSATSHAAKPAGGFERLHLRTAFGAEGGVLSTVDDMLRWLANMDAFVVGKAETWEAIKTPQTLSNGVSTGYGLGLVKGSYRGISMLSHAGGLPGNSAYLAKVPAAGLDVVVMLNRDDVLATDLVYRILDSCLTGLDSACNLPSRPLANGTFRSARTGRVVQLYASSGRQVAALDGGEGIPCEINEAGALSPAGVWDFVKWEIYPLGDWEKPSSLRLNDFGSTDDLTAVRADVNSAPAAIEGRYRSTATATEIVISQTNQGVELRTLGRFGSAMHRLECLGESVWRARSLTEVPWLGGLWWLDDSGNLHFTSPRTRSLPFTRIPRGALR